MNQPGSITGNPQAARPQTTVTTDGPAPLPSVSRSDRVPVLVWVIAAIFVAAELAVSGRYGFQQDELYFIVAGHHLAFGYVDQPPLAPLLTRITGILGVSPTAIRIIPALAGGAIAIMAARLAALFGAGRFGRVLAALATACAPVVIGAVHVGNTTPLDLLAWAAILLCVSTAVLRTAALVACGGRRGWCRARGRQPGGLAADRPRCRAPRLRPPPRAADPVAMARRRHRRDHLGAEHHLAGDARVAPAGHVRRPAPGEHLPGRLRLRRPASFLPGPATGATGHRGLRRALADP